MGISHPFPAQAGSAAAADAPRAATATFDAYRWPTEDQLPPDAMDAQNSNKSTLTASAPAFSPRTPPPPPRRAGLGSAPSAVSPLPTYASGPIFSHSQYW